jgi:hypothetical protein
MGNTVGVSAAGHVSSVMASDEVTLGGGEHVDPLRFAGSALD